MKVITNGWTKNKPTYACICIIKNSYGGKFGPYDSFDFYNIIEFNGSLIGHKIPNSAEDLEKLSSNDWDFLTNINGDEYLTIIAIEE